jgi:hypothetical protein
VITFDTQEDFEEAVKDIIRDSLSLYVGATKACWGEGSTVRVELLLDRNIISQDSSSF